MVTKHLIPAATIALLVALAGCTSVQDPFLTGSTMMAQSRTIGGTAEVPSHLALASLPGAGRVVSVRQTLGDNTASQTIVLAATTVQQGENSLTVEIGPARERRFRQAPSAEELRAEMRAAMPGVAMTVRPVAQENAYGVYAYAAGKGESGACIYAWQVTTSAGSGASIRLRLCSASASADQLAALMKTLSLKPLGADTLSMLRAGQASPVVAYAPVSVQSFEPVVEQETTRPTVVSQAPKAVTKPAIAAATIALPDAGVMKVAPPATVSVSAPAVSATVTPTTAATVPLPSS